MSGRELLRIAQWFALAVTLSACAAEPVTVYQRVYVRQEVPASLLTCAPWPSPDPVPADVFGLARWLAEGRAAWADCAGRLGEVRGLIESPRSPDSGQ